jgi:hypothetical protein
MTTELNGINSGLPLADLHHFILRFFAILNCVIKKKYFEKKKLSKDSG